MTNLIVCGATEKKIEFFDGILESKKLDNVEFIDIQIWHSAYNPTVPEKVEYLHLYGCYDQRRFFNGLMSRVFFSSQNRSSTALSMYDTTFLATFF